MTRRTRREAEWRDRIASDPLVCHGKPCFKGTRIMVASVLGSLAAGFSESETLVAYPKLAPDDVKAALAYAADLASGRLAS